MSAFRSLANSDLVKAQVRRQALDLFWAAQDYSDVVREAQEIVELATKGILRGIGVEPPKRHDVADLLAHYEERLPGGSGPAWRPPPSGCGRSGSSPFYHVFRTSTGRAA